MPLRTHTLDSKLAALDRELTALRPPLAGEVAVAVDRWLADDAALRFHLALPRHPKTPPVVAILGGTGTGKSTLVNRLCGSTVTASSFRRTFTSGPVAIAASPASLPEGWLALPKAPPEGDGPPRGKPDALVVVPTENDLTAKITLVDTPDLDGDTPSHHAQADRVFRWAQAVVFAVTPEKYQMTELLPYYRLAQRYGVPALFVMNKCETSEMLADYTEQLVGRGWRDPQVFAVPRDDAAYEPPPGTSLPWLREAILGKLASAAFDRKDEEREAGLANRAADLAGRLVDQVINPLRTERREADRLLANLRAMESPEPGVDVNPLTQQLQRRLQQRSVLYLMGPARMLQRARQVPGLLARLPRTVWDVFMRGKGVKVPEPPPPPAVTEAENAPLPDFQAAVVDQFSIVQSRIDDLLRSNNLATRWLAEGTPGETAYKAARIDPTQAARLAEEELAELRDWLEKRWNATPRDTAVLMRVLKHLPGGERLAKWSEAAPYLLAVVVAATQHALFGGVDLAVMGGFGFATWLTEKLSNEVSARTRAANRRIADRFTNLAHDQIRSVSTWLDHQAAPGKSLDVLERLAEDVADIAADAMEGKPAGPPPAPDGAPAPVTTPGPSAEGRSEP